MFLRYNNFVFEELISLECILEGICTITIIKSKNEEKSFTKGNLFFNSYQDLVKNVEMKIQEKIEERKKNFNIPKEIQNIKRKLENAKTINKMIPFFMEKKINKELATLRKDLVFLLNVNENNVFYFFEKIVFEFKNDDE